MNCNYVIINKNPMCHPNGTCNLNISNSSIVPSCCRLIRLLMLALLREEESKRKYNRIFPDSSVRPKAPIEKQTNVFIIKFKILLLRLTLKV